jgi:hypothetical protein
LRTFDGDTILKEEEMRRGKMFALQAKNIWDR